MTRIDGESKRKLREMESPRWSRHSRLVEALETQDDTLTLGMAFEERIKLVIDDAHASFTHTKVEGLIRRAGLPYPNADFRRLDLVEQCGLDRGIIAQLGRCTFIGRRQNVVFQGFTGTGKSYLGSALAKQACQHRYRAHYIRMPDLEEAWAGARDKPGGKEKFLRKYAAFTLLVIDEWLLDQPDDAIRSMLLELMEPHRIGQTPAGEPVDQLVGGSRPRRRGSGSCGWHGSRGGGRVAGQLGEGLSDHGDVIGGGV